MQGSDRRIPVLIVLLVACALLQGATRPVPEVTGGDPDAVRLVREGLSGRRAAQPQEWVHRAWSVLEAEGWPRARLRVDTVGESTAWKLELESGPRTTLGSVELRGPDPEVTELWRMSAGLEVGEPLSPGRFAAVLEDGLRAVSDDGYPLASATVVAQQHDEVTGKVALTILVRPGPRATVREIHVEGATRTRPDVIARLSGLRPGEWVVESRLEAARERLRGRPGLVIDVAPVEVLRVPGNRDEVDLRIQVEQDPRSGSFNGALGANQDATGEIELSGAVELILSDLFGTARSFRGRWSDDGRGRNRLDLAWKEPMLLGSRLDLDIAVGQRHEDDGYDMVLADLGLVLPARAGLQLGLTGGLDRTTFIGEAGRSRKRTRAGAVLSMFWQRGLGAGPYGAFLSDLQAAFVSDRTKDLESGESVEATVRHTLIGGEGRLGWAFSRYLALQTRAGWHSTENAPLPLPQSEQWAIGGATTVRGHPEDQYFGERVAFGGVESVFGPPRRGQAYLFFDAGWVRTTSELEGVTRVDENWLTGFGLGIRAPTALGSIDLSLGFADKLTFDEGKLHVALLQSF